jgi:hypothetical protein
VASTSVSGVVEGSPLMSCVECTMAEDFLACQGVPVGLLLEDRRAHGVG